MSCHDSDCHSRSSLVGFCRNVFSMRKRPAAVSNSTAMRGARSVPAGCRDLISSPLVVWRSNRARAAAWSEVDLPDSLGAEADRLAEAADVVQLDRVQDHADTSCRV